MFNVLISDDGINYEHLVQIKDLDKAMSFVEDMVMTKNVKYGRILPANQLVKQNTQEE